MTIHLQTEQVTVHHGDCLDVMRELADNSVDAVVCDPPYGLEFMGKDWDTPWKRGDDINADAGMATTGYTDGGNRLPRPTFTGSTNPKCQVCRGTRRGRRDGTAKVAVCLCDDGGRFPNVRAAEMLAFQLWCQEWTTEALRVLKPGGFIAAFGGTRTWHRLAVAVEDAGFEVRDSIAWLYGSGFPKSLDVSKAVDKLDAAEERLARAREFQTWLREHITPKRINEITDTDMGHRLTTHPTQPSVATAVIFDKLRPHLPEVPERIEELVRQRTVESENYKAREVVGIDRRMNEPSGVVNIGQGERTEIERKITTAHTPAAQQWAGWGTALKPAFEPIVVARKPLVGTVAANVLAHGTGALNIDATRIPTTAADAKAMERANTPGSGRMKAGRTPIGTFERSNPTGAMDTTAGRWPTNCVLDGDMAAELDEQSGRSTSSIAKPRGAAAGHGWGMTATGAEYSDSGGASRFFPVFRYQAKAPTRERPKVNGIAHPTCKPLTLMRWLVRLVTPPGGTVLDPFAGSGTTIEACIDEDMRCIGIEREADYLPLIDTRINRATTCRQTTAPTLFDDEDENAS